MEEAITDTVAKPIGALTSMAFKKSKFAVTKDLDYSIVWLGDCFYSITTKLKNVDPFEASSDIQKLQDMHDDLEIFFTKLAARARVQSDVMGSRGFTAEVCSFLSSPKQFVLRFKYAEQVNDLTSKLKNLASANDLCNKLPIDLSGNQNWCTSSEDTSPFPGTDVFIGRETDQENIIDLLRNNSVVAIVGVGGQGKTTLAQHVCQDHRVNGSFDKLLWVSLTPKSSVNEIFQKIIIYATGEKPGLEHLHLQVLQAIDGKKCLLVLDNLYFSKNLRVDTETLNTILQRGGFWRNGGKFLITARRKVVVKLRDAPKQYELPDLAEDNCWILLHHYAIKHEEEKECGVEEIGKEIARMCPKMPLVLKTIGCYLADKDYKSQWERFRNELASNPTLYISGQQKIKQILKLCYDQLDHNLKHCAAYCSLYPKGHLYNKNDMVRYWIALRFVEPRDGMSLEDVADEYVLELRQRAFFEEAGSFKVFKMHDVMHDLMLLIGKDKHQMIDSKTVNIGERVRHVSLNMQDLNWEVLLSSISGMQTLKSILLISPAWNNHIDGSERLGSGIDKLIPACQKLKVLEIYRQEIKKVPKSIGELTLVRHLNLSCNPLHKLPNEITKMENLSSLNLSSCHNLEELPRDMGKLEKLRHLWVSGCKLLRCMPEGFGNLMKLETLDEFVVGENSRSSKGKGGAKLEELGHLINLKGELRIRVAGESKYIASEAREAHLEKKKKLTKLEIVFERKAEEDEKFLEGIQPCGENWKEISILNYGGKKLPAWIMDDQFHKRLPKLYSFILGRTEAYRLYDDDDKDEFMRFKVKGNEEDMGEWVPIYSRIKEHLKTGNIELGFITRRKDGLTLTNVKQDVTLEEVCLEVNKELAPCSGGGCGGLRQPNFLLKSCFPNLDELKLRDIPELEVLPEEFRDLSSLTYLSIDGCGKLKAIPDWIDTFSSLKSLNISGAPELKVLPDSIGSLSSLETLQICDVPKLKVLPNSIGSLTSLKRLFLLHCTGLELLPHQISNLPGSCFLQIYKCSKALYEKCLKPTGEYWPHLQHLQYLLITYSARDRFEYRRPIETNESSSGDEISNETSTTLIPQSSSDVATTPFTLIGVPTHPNIYCFLGMLLLCFLCFLWLWLLYL